MQPNETSLKRSFLKFVIPSVLAQWVYALYTMVDGLFVAKGVNEVALTAVNICNPFLQLLFSLSLLFAVGTSTVSAILMGQKQQHQASEVFTQNVVTQVVLAAVLSLGVMTNLERVGTFLGARDPETLGYVVKYLRNIAPYSLAFLLSYTFEILMKTDGYPQRSVLFVIIGCVENCILDWLFVIVLHKGVAGAAFATSLSQCTAIVLYLTHFLSGKGTLRFCRFRFDPKLPWRQIRNGLSSGVTELSTGVVTLIFNWMILRYLSRDALVSYTIISYVNGIVVMSATGIAQGSQPLISYSHGEKNTALCRRLLRYGLVAAAALGAVAFAFSTAAADKIVAAYIGESLPELRAQSAAAMRIFALSFLLVGFNVTISGYLAAVERSISAACISAGRAFVLLLASLAVLIALLGGQGIWWAPLLAESVCLVMSIALLLRAFSAQRRRNA